MSDTTEAVESQEEVVAASNEVEEHNYVDEAKIYGWVPKEDFRDDPDRWVDAETFVKRGREINPILRKNNDILLKKHQSLQQELQEIRGTVSEFKKYHEETEKRAYDAAIAQLRSEKKEAISLGDGERVVQIDDQIDDLKSQREKKPEIQQQQPQVQIPQELVEWQEKNSWYGTDPEMTAVANAMGQVINQENPTLVGKPWLDALTKKVKQRFPEKFTRERPASVEGGGGGAVQSGTKGKSFKDLPKDAQEACVRFEKQGLLTRERYVKDFFGE